MTDERIRRKLAAILALDVVGFSRLMHADDAAAFALVRRMNQDIFTPCVEAQGGAIFKHTGDGVLARFDSVHAAFEAAERIIAQVIAGGEASLRIGIHLGDVIDDRGDVFGDSVNIACRLESLALHNGICVSERAWSDLRQRNLDFRDLGVQQLKNIETPIRVYLYDPSGTGDFTTAAASQAGATRRGLWRAGTVALAVLALAIAGGLAWLRPWAETPHQVLERSLASVPCSWLALRAVEETPSRSVARVGGYTNLPPAQIRELVIGALATEVSGDVEVDLATLGTIPELECGFITAASQYQYTGVPRAELGSTFTSQEPGRFAGKVPPEAQMVYQVRLFTSDFPPNTELFAIDANDGLQHLARVADIRSPAEGAGGAREVLVWSDTTTPMLFFILTSDSPVDTETVQASYRDAAGMRAFREAAEAGNWQLELVLLHQDEAGGAPANDSSPS